MIFIMASCAGIEAPAADPGGEVAIDQPAPDPEVEGSGPQTVHGAFPPPDGAVRVDGGDFGAWLGQLALRPEGTPVLTHDGRPVGGHRARVVDLPLVEGDLQQCADSAIRLRAEWLRGQGAEVMFHATSGDPMPWSRWQGGQRPFAVGNKLLWRPGTSGGWEAYLAKVFTWAGTRSLAHDTDPATDPVPGDLLVDPGSPGHAVVLLDVAQRDGSTWLLVGEGFMPAQDFHVELGPVDGWWPWTPEGGAIEGLDQPLDGLLLDHWHLPASGLRRFKPPVMPDR